MTDNSEYKIESRKIEGAKYEETATLEQLNAEEFLALVDTLLAVKGIKAVRWHQYTPFFNDGDTCEFGVNEASVKLSKRFGVDEEDGDYGDGFIDDYALYEYNDSKTTQPEPSRGSYGTPTYAEWRIKYDEWNNSRKVYSMNDQDTQEIAEALALFNSKTDNIAFVAKANFGDHAKVTATTDGFDVEEYEHD